MVGWDLRLQQDLVEKGRRLELDRVLHLLGWDLRLLDYSSRNSVCGLQKPFNDHDLVTCSNVLYVKYINFKPLSLS
jgi:hypothetical protein